MADVSNTAIKINLSSIYFPVNNETMDDSWLEDYLADFNHQDIGEAFMKDLLTIDSPFTIVLLVLYSSVFVIGLIGNLLVILVIIKYRHMRSITNMFFMNLSIGDLLVVLVCMPFSMAPYIYKVS